MEYQHNFADIYPQMYDRENRVRKAQTALCVLREELGGRIAQCRLLNVGSSSGAMDDAFANEFSEVVGVDIDARAVEFARANFARRNLRFELADGLDLPVEDASFDVAVCAQVYEHVPDQPRLLGEIYRVLKPGGICYFAATNRFILVEPHYRLWFLSWLPPFLADGYLRIAKRGERYYERMRSYRHLRKLVDAFEVVDYTAKIIADPLRYKFDYVLSPGSASQRIAGFIATYARWLCPGYVWVIRKSKHPSALV